MMLLMLKRQFTPKLNTFTCGAIYPSRLFQLEFLSFGDIGSRDVGPPSNVMKLEGMWLVVLRTPKNTCGKLNSHVSFQKSRPEWKLFLSVSLCRWRHATAPVQEAN